MRYYLDTEFIEDGKTIDLISIGLVCEQGATYYACSVEADLRKASPWVRRNVLPQLPSYSDPAWKTRAKIREDIQALTQGYSTSEAPTFYGYYSDYDWVVFCQLFGTMMGLPDRFPKYCRDLKQLLDDWPGTVKPEQSNEHNALEDAKWNKRLHEAILAEQGRQLDSISNLLRGGSLGDYKTF